MFWRKDSTAGPAVNPDLQAAADTPAAIDPAIEAKNIKLLTGDKPVIIQRDKRGSFVKLPGL